MSNPDLQDLLIYAGVPLAVIGLITALVMAASGRRAKRYRPGRPYEFAPVWFLARPDQAGPQATAGTPAGPDGRQLATAQGEPMVGLTGGASDRW